MATIEIKVEEKHSEKKPRMIGRYEIHETIGKGGYSWVKKGVDTKTKEVVALKFMERMPRDFALQQAEQVRTEIKCLTEISHPNVVKLHAYNLRAMYPLNDGGKMKTILLVLEYCPGGELFDILYYANRLDEVSARTYFHQLVYGLQSIHKAGIAHRDIKPQNLLLDSSFCLKITDFGLSKIMSSKDEQVMRTTNVGTRGFQAPEILKRHKYSNACDVFAAGVVLFILVAGYPPFEGAHKTDKWYNFLIVDQPEKFWDTHKRVKISRDGKALIEKMLCYKAKNRITLDEIIESKWFNGPVIKNDEIKSRIIKYYVQAQAEKKKDTRKMDEIIKSRPVYDVKFKAIPAEFISGGLEPADLRTFYTRLAPYDAIFWINHLLTSELHVATTFEPETQPHNIDCVVNLDDNKYEFSITAFQARESLHTLIHIEPIMIPDAIHWARYYRTVMEKILVRNILLQNVPASLLQKEDIS